jgi:hypothetical protein
MWFTDMVRPASPRTRKRAAERFCSEALTCPFGQIVNLSGTGIRLRDPKGSRPRVGRVMELPIVAPQGRLVLKARVVWSRRLRLRGFDAGLAFVDPRPGLATALRNLAQFGFIPQSKTEASDPDWMPPSPVRTRHQEACDILGVRAAATDDDIRRAYRALARRYHPDANSSPEAANRFHQITLAYHTLSDPAKTKPK